MKAYKKLALATIITITFAILTGCSEEEIIDFSSGLIAEIIISEVEQEMQEDEPELIESRNTVSESNSDSENTDSESNNKSTVSEDWQDGVYKYYYNQLTSEQQAIYNQLYKTVINMSEYTTLNLSDNMTQEDISIIFRSLRYDHPEVYWIQAYKYIVDGNNMYFYPNYLFNKEEKSLYDNMLEDWTERALESVNENMTDYEKELAIYDYIVSNTEYSLDAPLNQSLISVVQGESVCLGYTKAMKYLCDKIGLDCIVVEGISKGEGIAHSWNKIKINNEWYNVDSTNSNTAQIFSDSYDMFNITDELISLRYTETPIGESTDSKTGISFEYPVADSIEADYYNKNGLYIESLEEIETVVNNHKEDGTVTIRLGEQCSLDEIPEYMNSIQLKGEDGTPLEMKCMNYVTINYIRLLQISWG